MIKSDEVEIIGNWTLDGGHMVADSNCARISSLIQGYLQYIASSKDGWAKLYLDPTDNRYWELSYPHSDWHGGGPPNLAHISESEARSRYQLA
jgi:hypothetical protein